MFANSNRSVFFHNYNTHDLHNRSIYCTHHLPTRKKLLPKPCPICKRENGTVQLTVFPNARSNFVCRIGHYVAEEYKLPKDKKKWSDIDTIDLAKRKDSVRGKIWHSFRIEPKGHTSEIKDLQEHIKQYEKIRYSSKRKPITFSPEQIFYELIKETGWCMKPYGYYHGRKRRYSKYHFPKEEYKNRHDDEIHQTPD